MEDDEYKKLEEKIYRECHYLYSYFKYKNLNPVEVNLILAKFLPVFMSSCGYRKKAYDELVVIMTNHANFLFDEAANETGN